MPISVLVVDDSSMSRKLIIRALPDDWDVEVTEAADGDQALQAVRAGTVDIMFLDLSMPGKTGYQVLEEIQNDNLECFTIVVSADIQPMVQQAVKQLGAMAFISKPVEQHQVQAVLKSYGIIA